jgi:polysaccharide export outer membrane protein
LSVGSVYGIYNSNEVYGKWLLVDINGNIEIPRLGTTNVIGKTIPELKEEIKTKLKKWLVNPIVDLKVLNKEIAVMGEVKTLQ